MFSNELGQISTTDIFKGNNTYNCGRNTNKSSQLSKHPKYIGFQDKSTRSL